jgi:hypothetical protein
MLQNRCQECIGKYKLTALDTKKNIKTSKRQRALCHHEEIRSILLRVGTAAIHVCTMCFQNFLFKLVGKI